MLLSFEKFHQILLGLFRKVHRVSPWLLLALALTNWAGWIFDWPLGKSIVDGYPPMMPASAAGSILCALALLLYQYRPESQGILINALALLFLAIFSLHPSLGNLAATSNEPNIILQLPSIGTAISFGGIAIVILLVFINQSFIWLNQIVATIAFIPPLIVISSYVIAPQALFQSSIFSTMSIPTTFAILLFWFNFAFIHPGLNRNLGMKFAESKLNIQKIFLPIAIFIPMLLILAIHNHMPADWLSYRYHDIVILAFFIAFTVLALAVYSDLENKLDKKLDQETSSRKQAEASLQEKVDMVNLLNHEFRNQLSTLLQSLNLIQTSDLDSENRELLDLVEKSGGELNQIVNDALQISKSENSPKGLVEKKFNIKTQLVSIVDLNSVRLNPRIKLNLDIAPDIPAHFTGDENKIKIIFRNLVTNAIKYTEKGRIDISLNWADRKQHTLEFRVKDTGIGIPENFQEKMFHSFSRGDNAIQRGIQGIGLGLRFTREFLQIMHGRLEVSNNPEGGATFCAYFRLEPCKYWLSEKSRGSTCSYCISESAVLKNKPLAQSRLGFLQQAHILIAEDNPVNSLLLEKQLRSRGMMHIKIVSNGQSAVQEIRNHKFDILLLDMFLGDMTGFDVFETIKRMADCPDVMLLSGDTSEELEIRCMQAGMRDVLPKPYNIQQLMERMLTIYEQRHKFVVTDSDPSAD